MLREPAIYSQSRMGLASMGQTALGAGQRGQHFSGLATFCTAQAV